MSQPSPDSRSHAPTLLLKSPTDIQAPLSNPTGNLLSPLSRIPLPSCTLYLEDTVLYITCCTQHSSHFGLPLLLESTHSRENLDHRLTLHAELFVPLNLSPLCLPRDTVPLCILHDSPSQYMYSVFSSRISCPCCLQHASALSLPFANSPIYTYPSAELSSSVTPQQVYATQSRPSTPDSETVQQMIHSFEIALQPSSPATARPLPSPEKSHPRLLEHLRKPSPAPAAPVVAPIIPPPGLSIHPVPPQKPAHPTSTFTPHTLNATTSIATSDADIASPSLPSDPLRTEEDLYAPPPRTSSTAIAQEILPLASADKIAAAKTAFKQYQDASKSGPPAKRLPRSTISHSETFAILALETLFVRHCAIKKFSHKQAFQEARRLLHLPSLAQFTRTNLSGIYVDLSTLRKHVLSSHKLQFMNPDPPTNMTNCPCTVKRCIFYPRSFETTNLTIIQEGFLPSRTLATLNDALSAIPPEARHPIPIVIDDTADLQYIPIDLDLFKL